MIVVIVESRRNGEVYVFVKVEVLDIGHPVAMRCLVMHVETKRLVGGTLLQKINRMLCDQISGITFFRHIFAIGVGCLNTRIVIFALVSENLVFVKTTWFAEHVPLSNHAGLIAGLLKQLRHEGDRRVKHVVQHGLSVLMTIQAGKQASSTWGRE